jgi:hypothetical protein
MDFSNDVNMQNTEMGANDDNLQVVEDQVVQEESEELVFEETETDAEMQEDGADDVKTDSTSITILGYTLDQNQFLMIGGLLVLLVAFFYKDLLMEFVNELMEKFTGKTAELNNTIE